MLNNRTKLKDADFGAALESFDVACASAKLCFFPPSLSITTPFAAFFADSFFSFFFPPGILLATLKKGKNFFLKEVSEINAERGY